MSAVSVVVGVLVLAGGVAWAEAPAGGAPDGAKPPAIRGSLDKAVIRRVIQKHLGEVRSCYERGLAQNRDLTGRLLVRFTIEGSGEVSTSENQGSTLNHPATEQCIVDAVKTWVFPKPMGGGRVIVSYPFVLKPQGGVE